MDTHFGDARMALQAQSDELNFDTHFGQSVKNDWTQISGAEIFGSKIQEHVWIQILEMQARPHMHKLTN